MSVQVSSSQLDRFVRFLFAAGLVAIPFSGIGGVSGLGEMAHELSTYVFLLALLTFGFVQLSRATSEKQHILPKIAYLPRIALFFFGVLFLSFATNFFDISSASFRGRHGFEKFINSLLTVSYCFSLALFAYVVAEERWKRLLAKPIAISVILCAVFGALEVAARWFGIGNGVYLPLSNLVHGAYGEMKLDERIRSLAFEPPWLGNYLGFAFPWIVSAWYASRRTERLFYGAVLAMLLGLLGVSLARTGFVMVAGGIATLFLLRRIYLSPAVSGWAHRVVTSFLIALGLLCVFVAMATEFGGVVARVIASDSTTNISRMASILAGFSMFADHPLFGVGFGQYGFHVERYLPYWAYYSTEFTIGPDDGAGAWPSSYSIYARLGAELGIFGYALWFWLWGGMIRKTVRITRALASLTGAIPSVAYPLLMTFVITLFSGISTESLRAPMIWISLGVGCRYLAIASSARVETIKPASNTSSLEA